MSRAAFEHVIAFAAIEGAVLLGADECVFARRTVEDFCAFAHSELGQHVIDVQASAVVEVETVDTLPTVEPVLDTHRITRSGNGGDQVVAVAGEGYIVLTNARLEQHSAIVVGNGVLAIAGTEAIGVVTAQILELVVASATIERVILITANDGVVAIGGRKRPRGQVGAIPNRAVGKAQLLDTPFG